MIFDLEVLHILIVGKRGNREGCNNGVGEGVKGKKGMGVRKAPLRVVEGSRVLIALL